MDSSVTIIVESYNFTEDRDAAPLRRALHAACELRREDPAGREVILTDAAPSGALSMLLKDFPEVRSVAASGLSYDEAKFRAVREARGEYVVFLDGDCVPQPGWLEAHCAALRSGEAVATGGFTRYEGGWFAALCTLLDFGFLLPLERRSLGCYASNNSGFHRPTLLEIPMCESELRCNCYAHAQALMRARKPVLLIPEARVRHKTPLFFWGTFPPRFRHGGRLPRESRITSKPMAAARHLCSASLLLRIGRTGLAAAGFGIPRSRVAALVSPIRGALVPCLPAGRFMRDRKSSRVSTTDGLGVAPEERTPAYLTPGS